MAGLSRAESMLVLTASSVLVAGVVAVPLLYDDSGPPSSAPAPVPTVAPPPVPVRISQLRVTTYSRGSHQLVVRVMVSTGASAALEVDGVRHPLHLLGGEATGTVPVTCRGPVPLLTLVVQLADGSSQQTSLGRPSGPFAEACATARPVPTPTVSSRAS